MGKKMDRQTERIFSEGEKLKALTENSGWAIARTKLLKKAASLMNIMDITNPDPNNIATVVGIRQETAKALLAWLNEIEGTVEQHKANGDAFAGIKDEYIININDLEPEEK